MSKSIASKGYFQNGELIPYYQSAEIVMIKAIQYKQISKAAMF